VPELAAALPTYVPRAEARVQPARRRPAGRAGGPSLLADVVATRYQAAYRRLVAEQRPLREDPVRSASL
jgi:hypothetical protein